MHPVLHVRAFEDNYIWLIRGQSDSRVALVDPGDAEPVLRALPELGLTPCAILCTHHHGDHVGGVETLLRHYPGLPVYGPGNENIHEINRPVADGDVITLPELGVSLQVLGVPGHTRGHVAYTGHGWLFCGDTLFSAGCGRLFEGTAAQMHASLSRLAAMPRETLVYCAHEYTLANLRFAAAVEPGNTAIGRYRAACEARIRNGEPTIPSTVARELEINPFLRSAEPAVAAAAAQHAGIHLENAAEVFAAVRKWKDTFR
jgi:hydroxyacylglutathione hydrolase